jgi:cobalamin biosynthesis Mg chelatase CobN
MEYERPRTASPQKTSHNLANPEVNSGDATEHPAAITTRSDDPEVEHTVAKGAEVLDLASRRPPRTDERRDNKTQIGDTMAESPTREEIVAQIAAAEARTETRITQLGASMEARATATDHKVDVLIGKVDALAGAVTTAASEARTDNRETRRAIWAVGLTAVIAVLGLVVALWIAGVNVQANMIATFQTAIGVRSMSQEVAPKGSPAASPPAPMSPASPTGK